MEHPVFFENQLIFAEKYRVIHKKWYFFNKNGAFFLKMNVPFFMEHPVFRKILNFGPNFHHLFATIT